MRGTCLILVLLSSGLAQANDCVVLLHGLMRSSMSMNTMQRELDAEGYILTACRANEDIGRIHFVTHSLGGILLRQYLSANEIPELGRVVMMGPPNQGSAAVDELEDVPGFDWLNGPAGRQLGKGEESVPLALGPAEFELGVIAGNRTIYPITSSVLENPDDGRVSVEDTKLDGMADFVVVDHSHAFMMRMQRTIELTIEFLRSGSF